MPLLTTSTMTASSCCTAVASSWPVIRKSPSPAKHTTVRVGMHAAWPRPPPGSRSPSSRWSARAACRSRDSGRSDAPRSRSCRRRWHMMASGRQVLREPAHDLAHLQRAGRRAPAPARRDSRHARGLGRRAQGGLATGASAASAAAKLRGVALIGRTRLIDAAQLLGVGMDMDQALLRHRDVDQRVAAAWSPRRAARPPTIRRSASLMRCAELGVDADADIAGIAGMSRCRTGPGGGRRSRPADRWPAAKASIAPTASRVPLAAAQQQDRPLGARRARRAARASAPAPGCGSTGRRARRRRPRPPRSACPRAAPAPPGRAARSSRCGRRGSPARACGSGRRSRRPIWRAGRTCGGSRSPGTPRARARRAAPGRRTG